MGKTSYTRINTILARYLLTIVLDISAQDSYIRHIKTIMLTTDVYLYKKQSQRNRESGYPGLPVLTFCEEGGPPL
jgi:hypothetical protein